MRFLFLILFFVLAGSLILLILFRKNAKVLINRTKNRLINLDEKYRFFIQKRMTLSIIEKEDLEGEKGKILSEAMTVMKPELDALVTDIHAVIVPTVRRNYSSYSSEYFNNVVSLAEELFFAKKLVSERVVEDSDREKLYKAFQEAIEADITQRMLDIKTEANLSS